MPTVQDSETSVVVHPLVLLSVTDHAARVAKSSKKRVVGILLGQDNGKTINVANSFAVPFEEDERDPKTWYMDHDYIESMNDMFKKVNAREKLVGWYHSGPRLRASDLEINQVVKRYCAKPVMVIVDVQNRATGIPTDAYLAIEEIKDDGTETQKTFLHIPSSIGAEEAEEIGVEHLLRDIKDLNTATLSTRVSDQLSSLVGLQTRLHEIRSYLSQVNSGELPVNYAILYNLQDVFNLLPNLEGANAVGAKEGKESDEGKRPFTVATNDQLLVMYLSSLIRAVISLHDLVNNKIELANGENEQQQPKKEEDEKLKEAEKKEEKVKQGDESKTKERGL